MLIKDSYVNMNGSEIARNVHKPRNQQHKPNTHFYCLITFDVTVTKQ